MANTVSNLDEQVREALRTRIISGDLSGGAHLSELKLSKEFNVSRTPIREALCALAADGLIEMVPHRGAFVRTVSETEQQDNHFIYNGLVSLATRTAVERIGIENLFEFENVISATPSSNNYVDYVKYAENVINSIFTLANSPALNKAVNAVERGMTSAPMWLNESANLEQIKQEFTYLLGAFKRSKPDAAEKTMRTIMSYYTQVENVENSVENSAFTATQGYENAQELNA